MFNLFTEDAHGKPIWLGAVADLQTAWLRLTQLAAVNAGEYFIFNLCTKQIVGSLVSIDEEVSNDTTWASACTPASVRPATVTRTG